MPVFRFDNVANKARKLKGLLTGRNNAWTFLKIRRKRQKFKRVRAQNVSNKQESKQLRDEIENIRDELRGKLQESKRIDKASRAAEDPAEKSELTERKIKVQREISRLKDELSAARKSQKAGKIGRRKRKKGVQQELFRLERELQAAKERAEGEQGTGALPDFVVIGGKKCGTSYLYHLLTQHPFIEPAASKELHFFDTLFDEGIEWYRRFFPQPKFKDGRRTITGEGTPYMAHRLAPERMAQVVPEARLIALLRNPVDRAYSDYQMVVRKEREPKTFEEAIGLKGATGARQPWPLDKDAETSEGEDRTSFNDDSEYLSRSVYVDQLLRWSEFFAREQMLVLKSEDLFERPKETLKVVLEFLDLPRWEPEASETRKERKKRDIRNAGGYEGGMDPATRRRLEEYFEPHNKRLYDYLGTDFGW